MLLMLATIVAVFWLIALFASVSGGFVNFLLVMAIVLAIAHFMGRRTHTV